MKIRELKTGSNGARSFEIRVGTISYRALLRCIRGIPGAVIVEKSHNPMNDDTWIIVKYKGVTITLETPFSDYIVHCTHTGAVFDEFVSQLESYPVRWWEHIF